MTRVAVIGLGNMGKYHAKNYSKIENIELIAVCDINEELANTTAKKFSCKAYTDYQEMLNNENIDAVSIVVPTSLHKEVALKCIERNIDVLVEKPIATKIEDAEEIIQKAKENNVILQIGHVERFNPAVQKLKKLVENGKLGTISSIIARRVGTIPIQIRDANVIIDLAVHDIDIINYIFEGYPDSVVGNIGKTMNDREDHSEIFLRYGKKSGFIQVNWITPIKIRNLIITGSKGYAELDYLTQKLIIYENNYVREIIDEYGDHVHSFGIPDKVHVGVENNEPLFLELIHFINCVKTREEPLVNGRVGLDALRVALEVMKNE